MIAAILGALGVMLGAFGAHTLKSKITPESLEVLKTGVLYLFVHVPVILGIVLLSERNGQVSLRVSAVCMLLGIVLFTGSLALIATSSLTGLSTGWLGPLTPIGGICFIAGWAALVWFAARARLETL